MTETPAIPSDQRPRLQRAAWLWLAGGTIATVLILGTAESLAPRSVALIVMFRTLMLVGITLSCVAYWRASRIRAGDRRRAELVGIVVFSSLAAVTGRSTSDLLMQAAWLDNVWNTLQIVLAVGVGLLVTKWLQGVDAREAARNAANKMGASS